MQRRPRRDMDLLAQARRMVLQQRLAMFPARQRAHAAHALDVHHVVQAGAARVPEHGAFHVRGLEFAALHDDLALGGDDALRDVQAVVVVLGEAEDDGDVGGLRGGADLGHFGGGVG